MCRIGDTRSCATRLFGCLSDSCVGSLAPEGQTAALYDLDSGSADCAAQRGDPRCVQHFCLDRVL